jgi:hypothetical protein
MVVWACVASEMTHGTCWSGSGSAGGDGRCRRSAGGGDGSSVRVVDGGGHWQ